MIHFVYYLFDGEELVYIGRSTDPERRRRAFRQREGFEVQLGLSQRHKDFEKACAAELLAIETHAPKYNKKLVSTAAMLGKRHAESAKVRTEDFRQRCRTFNAGRSPSPETRAKLSAASKGKPKTQKQEPVWLKHGRKGNGRMIKPEDFVFFLDSGAYSAWTRGTAIDIDEFIAFIKANIEHIEVYACLDCIPGQPGKAATERQRNEAADQTWHNYLYMKAEGLDPLPVYHYGEDMRHLERMLAYGCDYIGIGGLVSVPSQMRRHWLDRVFKRITDADGRPLVKTHGFGMTSVPLIFRYPWFSVDSTSWIQATANGAVLLPALVGDTFVFDRAPTTVMVSAQRANSAANTMSSAMRAILDRWLAECGKTYQEVSEHYFHRAVVNVSFFKRVSEQRAEHPFKPDGVRMQSLWQGD